jgi:hypothetical protein
MRCIPSHHKHTATGGACAWLDVGVSTGSRAVGSIRPAVGAGSARGLLKQFVAVH